MALHFDSSVSNTYVDVAAGGSVDDLAAFTSLLWMYPTEVAHSTIPRIWSKGGGKYFSTRRSGADGTLLRVQVNRATTTAALESVSGTLETNVWQCYAVTYDETDGPRLFKGKLDSVLAEVSYGSRTVGAGATSTDNTQPLRYGNRETPSNNDGYRGRIAVVLHIAKRCTLAELHRLQFSALPVGVLAETEVAFLFGYAGTGTQPDWSGNANNGAVTAATVADHVPLGAAFGFAAEWEGAFTAAAGGGGLSIPVAMYSYRKRRVAA